MQTASAAYTRSSIEPDTGLACVAGLASYYRIPADPAQLARDLSLRGRPAEPDDLIRAANQLGLRARQVRVNLRRLRALPVPAVIAQAEGGYSVYGGMTPDGLYRVVDPLTRVASNLTQGEVRDILGTHAVLVQRRWRGAGQTPKAFGLSWFLPSIWRYRKPLAHALAASLVLQLFALVTPLFFQVTVDKVLVHKGYSTLYALVAGLALLGIFDVVLQQLRSYALSHTTSRIDVELGRRLFHHVLRLPLGYFETRAAGQTVARIRELESIRAFLTGQGLTSAIDFVFAFIFIAVLACYSVKLTLVVVATLPVFFLISVFIRPVLTARIKERFDTGALSQQMLVESVIGIQTIKAAAVEPAFQTEWEEKLASYVRTSFDAAMLASLGQNAIQYVSKIMTAVVLLFGAKAVMDGEMSVGGLIAFNLISAQVVQPVLRLSQLWQDFQQVQISVQRLGDILNAPTERVQPTNAALPPPQGAIEFRNVSFRYASQDRYVLTDINFNVRPNEVIGIVGPSGSGKSTLTKMIQRLYVPEQGQVLVDGLDVSHVDPGWLRRNIGVVLQDNLLFNRSVHDNIALSDPSMSRAQVMHVARLAGAEEFIAHLPAGYDTIIEERGANLSGGQRQRLAIARALANNPPILLFDEATSALDYESECVIHRNMRMIAEGRTVVIIAHRLAAVRQCDRIISLANGRIVEIGSHDDLVRQNNGLYARLWSYQVGQAQGLAA